MNIFDSVWTYVVAAVGVIASIVTILSFKRKREKEFSILLLVNTRCVNIPSSLFDKVNLRFNNKETKEIWRVVFVIANSGEIPIKASDFEGNIILNFEKDIEIFDLSLDDKSPTTLNAVVVKSSGGFSIKPTLFNSNDLITINAYVNKEMKQVQIQGRIKGVKNIKFHNEVFLEKKREKRKKNALILLMVGFISFFTSLPYVMDDPLTSFSPKLVSPMLGFSFVLIGAMIFKGNNYRSKVISYRILRANKWINVDDSIIKF